MAKKLILYGPSASGKTTLIREIAQAYRDDVSVIELERIASTNDRRNLLAVLESWTTDKPLVITAANVDMPEIPSTYEVVLLWIDNRGNYLERVAEQIAANPSKAKQDHEVIYDLMRKNILPLVGGRISLKLNTWDTSPADLAKAVVYQLSK